MKYSNEVWLEVLDWKEYIYHFVSKYKYIGLEKEDIQQIALIAACKVFSKRDKTKEKYPNSFKVYLRVSINTALKRANIKNNFIRFGKTNVIFSHNYLCYYLINEEKITIDLSILSNKEKSLIKSIISGMTLKEIAAIEGVTRQHIGNRKLKIIKKIKLYEENIAAIWR